MDMNLFYLIMMGVSYVFLGLCNTYAEMKSQIYDTSHGIVPTIMGFCYAFYQLPFVLAFMFIAVKLSDWIL